MSRPFPRAARRAFACAFAATFLCAASAHADDNIELYGLIGTYFGSIKHSDKIDRITQVGSGGLTTSWWGVRGSEDLGGDTKAVFELEQFFQPDTGGAGRSTSDPGGFSRNGFVGLSNSSYGTLTFGRQTSPYYLSMQMVNPFGASVVFSPLVVQSYVAAFNNTLIGDNVWNNVIQYASPTVGGFSANLTYAPGEVAGNASVNNASINLHYIQGPLTAVLSAQRIRTAAVAPSTGQEAYLTGLAYNFGWAKLYAAAQRTDNAVTDITSRTWELGTSVPCLPTGAILFSWAHTEVDNPAVKVGGHDTASLGYDYFMSRRTDVYAMYTYDHNQGQMVGNSYALGIRHSF